MDLYQKIKAAYPELESHNFGIYGEIVLRNDSDGLGDYIEKWNYDKPIPPGLKLGK